MVFYEGSSSNFGRVIYNSKVAFIPEDTTTSGLPRLYESTSSALSSLKLVGVDDSGKVIDPVANSRWGSDHCCRDDFVSCDFGGWFGGVLHGVWCSLCAGGW